MSANDQIKVLIIEDNDVISRLWQITLEAEGFKVDVAVTGAEGVEKAEAGAPSIILLDLIMPDMHGFEIFERLKLNSTTSIPVVILSNLSAGEEIQKARELGAADFIIKSTILPEQLVGKIRRILSQKG